jgi:hypothetical protein
VRLRRVDWCVGVYVPRMLPSTEHWIARVNVMYLTQGFSALLAGFGRLGLLSGDASDAFAPSSASVSRRQFLATLVGVDASSVATDVLHNTVVSAWMFEHRFMLCRCSLCGCVNPSCIVSFTNVGVLFRPPRLDLMPVLVKASALLVA